MDASSLLSKYTFFFFLVISRSHCCDLVMDPFSSRTLQNTEFQLLLATQHFTERTCGFNPQFRCSLSYLGPERP